MIFTLFLPLFAAFYIFAAAFLKKRTFAWEVGTAAVGLAFLNIVSMAFKSFFHGKVYSAFLLPFLTLDGSVYDWRLHLEINEIFLAVFIVFSALMSLLFVKDYLVGEKKDRFVVFLLGLVSSLIIAIGSKNMFQFFAGWDLSAMFAYLLLMLFHEKQAVRRSGVNFLVWHTLTDIPLFCAFFMLAGKTGTFFLPPFIEQAFFAFHGSPAIVFAVLVLLGVSAKLFLFGTNILIAETAGISIPALAFIAPAALGGLGVYVLYLCFPFVSDDKTVRMIFIIWGGLTVLCGLLTAAAQTNIKVLLCQLLMSQFGFVLCVFGIIGKNAAFCSYIALITPMTGLIFCVGTVIAALQGEEDLLRMGGLRKLLPYTFWTMMLLILCCIGFPQIGNSGVIQDMYTVLAFEAKTAGPVCLTVYLFFLSWVFSRLVFRLFFAPLKLSATAAAKITQPSKMMALPLTALLLLSLFQNKVFEASVLPDLSGHLSVEMLFLSLLGICGLPAGIWFFGAKERSQRPTSELMRRIGVFCAKGFYLTAVYEVVFVKPCLALADFAWRFAGAELLTEKLPKALKQAAEKVQKARSERPSDFLVWSLAGLFALIFSLLFFQAGG